MKKKFIILFIILIVYHLLFKTWWTPVLYYAGTYLTLIFALRYIYKKEKSFDYILLIFYFSLIFIFLTTSINKDIEAFYKRLNLREFALGYAGIGIMLLMFMNRGKRKDN